MSDFKVSDYGIFGDAANTTNVFKTTVNIGLEAINGSKTALSNESVFMGPLADSCIEALSKSNNKLENIISGCGAVIAFLAESNITYQSGDKKASKILSFNNGSFSTSTFSNSGVQTGKTNQDTIYNYLSQKGFNDAAISGILANIQHESGFDPTAVGDGGTSYGICQWHDTSNGSGRWTNMVNYCNNNNLNPDSVEGQVNYLVYELENNYPNVYEKIKNVPNTADGAYDAAYEWTVNYEIPANAEVAGQNRGDTAVSSFWSTYSDSVNT